MASPLLPPPSHSQFPSLLSLGCPSFVCLVVLSLTFPPIGLFFPPIRSRSPVSFPATSLVPFAPMIGAAPQGIVSQNGPVLSRQFRSSLPTIPIPFTYPLRDGPRSRRNSLHRTKYRPFFVHCPSRSPSLFPFQMNQEVLYFFFFLSYFHAEGQSLVRFPPPPFPLTVGERNTRMRNRKRIEK